MVGQDVGFSSGLSLQTTASRYGRIDVWTGSARAVRIMKPQVCELSNVSLVASLGDTVNKLGNAIIP